MSQTQTASHNRQWPPPPAKVRRVEDFMGGYPIEDEPRFKSLAFAMDEGEREFCKAMVMFDGQRMPALRYVFPDLADSTLTSKGRKWADRKRVKRLIEYLEEMAASQREYRPLDRDYVVRKLENAFRMEDDPRELIALLKTLQDYRPDLKADAVEEDMDAIQADIERLSEGLFDDSE